jgi:acetylornithine deacetylase/succinyl-diaminopimelate desuccinylase-like protein
MILMACQLPNMGCLSQEMNMSRLDAPIAYAQEHSQDSLEDLKAILRIPSISTLPENKPDMEKTARWIADQLETFGFESISILPTGGHPIAYGEWLKAGDDAPTILIYGHYDVQPPDPLDMWTSGPFDPVIRGDDLFARGASDMKGQLVAHLKAVEAMLHTTGLPVNLKYMIEGEEEVGSPNLAGFIESHKDLLLADFCLNVDSSILEKQTPSLTYSLRGLAYFELRVQGPIGDLHSGTFGGVVDNPAYVLCKLIAGMRDEKGRITLPGFYDPVRALSDEERASTVSLPESWWLEQTGAPILFGEEGYTPTERGTARPTFEVNGLLSGFTGEGSKTVLPAKSMAKLSMRLVPDQRPEEVQASLIAYLEANAPPTVTWELEDLSSCLPAISERDSEAVRAASRALESVWGKAPVFVRTGGSVPVVGLIKDLLGLDTLMMGFGLPDDNLHAPNEKQHLPNFYRGIETYIRFSHEIAR